MFKPTIGAADITYRSQAEAKISYMLYKLGFVSHDTFYPWPFVDSNGEQTRAKSDFICPITGIYLETKTGYMNGLKTKASADNAMARFNAKLAEGYINASNYNHQLLQASWSDSVQKFKAVQYQSADRGRCVALIFDTKPDEETVKRLERAKVFWCVYGDEYFRRFMSFRTLAKHGFRAEYTIKGHVFKSHGGIDC